MQESAGSHRTVEVIPCCAVFTAGLIEVRTLDNGATFFAMGANDIRCVLHAIVDCSLLQGVSHNFALITQDKQKHSQHKTTCTVERVGDAAPQSH